MADTVWAKNNPVSLLGAGFFNIYFNEGFVYEVGGKDKSFTTSNLSADKSYTFAV